MHIASLILGIIAIITCLIPIFDVAVSLIALIIAIAAMCVKRPNNEGKGVKIAGLVLSIIALVISLFMTVIPSVLLIANLDTDLIEDAMNELENNEEIRQDAQATLFKSDMLSFRERYSLYLANKMMIDSEFNKSTLNISYKDAQFEEIFGADVDEKYKHNLKIVNGELVFETDDEWKKEILKEMEINSSSKNVNNNYQHNTNTTTNNKGNTTNSVQKNEEQTNNNEKLDISNGHMISTRIGRFTVFSNGNTYFEPEVEITLPKSIAIFGQYSYGEFHNNPEMSDKFTGYKLNLSNIKTVYYLECPQNPYICVLFLDKSGNLSALNIKNDYTSYDLIKNIKTNVVSVAEDNSYGTTEALIIDNQGKEYTYSAGSKNCELQTNTIQVLATEAGSLILDSNKNLYYIPALAGYYWPSDQLNVLSTKDFVYGTYAAAGYKTLGASPFFEGYKIDVSDVQSMYKVVFGNGTPNVSIMLVHKDGKISEITFSESYNLDKVDAKITKHVSGYSNIVNVVPFEGFEGNYAKLVNKAGNLINYFGVEYK